MKRILNISLKSKFYMEIILQPHTQAPNMKNIIVIFSLFFILSAQAQDNNKKDTNTSKSAPLSAPVGQHAAMMMDNSYDKPIDYIPEALGEYEWKITTSEAEAQQYFKQGMQLRWAYNVNEAARSMAEARRIDPNCAMCYWGEAFALGSFLNGHMTTEKGMRGRKAILKAVELTDGNTSNSYDLCPVTIHA